MGGLFSSLAPAPLSPPPPPDSSEADRKARLEAIDRRRRGRAGTIATSERGIFDSAEQIGLKTKLGE